MCKVLGKKMKCVYVKLNVYYLGVLHLHIDGSLAKKRLGTGGLSGEKQAQD